MAPGLGLRARSQMYVLDLASYTECLHYPNMYLLRTNFQSIFHDRSGRTVKEKQKTCHILSDMSLN